MNPKTIKEFLAIDLRPGDLVLNLPVSCDGSVLFRLSPFAYLILSTEETRDGVSRPWQHAVLGYGPGRSWSLTTRNPLEIWAPEGAWQTYVIWQARVFRRGGEDR